MIKLVHSPGTSYHHCLCVCRKWHSTHSALLRFVDSCKMVVDEGRYAGPLLVNLSKAFDCINHELLIAEFHAYRFSMDALLQIYSNLVNRRQRVKYMEFTVHKNSKVRNTARIGLRDSFAKHF